MSKQKTLRLICRECKKEKSESELTLWREPNMGHHYYICKGCSFKR